MSDLISRDRLRGELAGTNFNNINDWKKINEIIDRQPDGQKHGHWYYKDRDDYDIRCSVCDEEAPDGMDAVDIFKYLKYCPYCGAKMDEVAE